MTLDDASERYLASQSRGRLATVGPDGAPQNKPVGFVYNAELGTIDIVGFSMELSAKYRNVGVNPNVAFVADDAVSEGAAGTRFLEIRGQAERVSVEPPATAGVSSQIIRIHPRRVISWNIHPDHPGLRTLDVPSDPGEPGPIRPSLGTDGGARRADQAVADFVEELQAGWDQHDADITNRHFASDIVWGSPFGATLQGYEQLHAIHVRLKQQARGGTSSRYEIVRVLAPTPDVAIAQVRRVALDSAGHPLEPTSDATGAFSEMALYVLVRRDRTWWLAAGQNTLVRPGPPESRAHADGAGDG
jgi:pyridoxamine 5'-phosphate oxidase family protein